jgi:glycosyltransferase involved in cell wall biosynthesis
VHSEPLSGELRGPFTASGVAVETLNHRRGDYRRRLAAHVWDYQIVLGHVRFFDYFSSVPWLLRLCDVRHVVFTDANSGEWEPRPHTKHFVRLRAQVMCKPLTRVIAISAFIRNRLIDVGVRPDRIAVIHNGVDPERFRPDAGARLRLSAAFPLDPDDVVVATVASLLPFKNVDVILEACAALLTRGVPVRLFVAGEGPLLADLQDLSLRLGIARRVHWLGAVPDPTTLLQASDVFTLASVGEAFGNVLAEAMGCGVPVVATRSGGIQEVVEDGATGHLVPPGSPQALAEAVEALAKDRTLRQAMGARGVERVRQRFTVDRAVQETVAVYRSILNGRFA